MNLGELLTQATCAVLDGSPSDHNTAIGTAWLAKDDGHLLTAGHVVKDLQRAGEIWLRFPDADRAERATFAMPAVHNTSAALDYAVIKLDEPNGRKPLPFTLVSRAEGPVRVRGYPASLPNAQSGGDGVLNHAGNYLRAGMSWAYWFQYSTTNLAEPGFSGAAVYSDLAKAVIGLHVGGERGRQGFAMPLARIAERWAELIASAIKPTRGVCVLIQSAASPEEHRETVQQQIVRPVADELNLALYVSRLGGTLHEDLEKLELADVVIADVSHFDPSVIYELTVAQGLGTPDVVITDVVKRHESDDLFDEVQLDLRDVPAARDAVRQRLLTVRSISEALGEAATSNPLTSYFKAPLTQISAAHALALGYATNFVIPVGKALLDISAGRGPGTVTVDGIEVDPDQLMDVSLAVVLPRKLAWANDDFIDERIARAQLAVPAQVTHEDWSRPRSMKCLPIEPGEPIRLLDVFPTTLSTMSESIDERLGVDSSKRFLPQWTALESKEIDRFQSKLVRQLRTHEIRVAGRGLSEVVTVAPTAAVFPGFAPAA